MSKIKRTPTLAVDSDGLAIVRVYLSNHPIPAEIEREDYDALTGAGASPNWIYNSNGHGQRYVRSKHPDTGKERVQIGRIVAGAGRGQIVRYRDGDRLNLRRSNLVVAGGYARTADTLSAPS